MKIFRGVIFAALSFCLLTLVGCAGNGNIVNNDNLEIAPIECPKEGGPYAYTYTSDMKGKGGGIAKLAGLCGGKCTVMETTTSPDGKIISQRPVQVDCETTIGVAAVNPDRASEVIPTLATVGGNIAGSLIQAAAIRDSASKQQHATTAAAAIQAEAIRNAGPSAVSFTDVRTYTNTAVDVSEQTKYFDPTK